MAATTGMNAQQRAARLRITARRADTRRIPMIRRLFLIPTLHQRLPVEPRRSIITPAYAERKGHKPLLPGLQLTIQLVRNGSLMRQDIGMNVMSAARRLTKLITVLHG